MSDCQVSRIRKALETLAKEAVGIDPERVILGNKDFKQGDQFFRTLGIYSIIAKSLTSNVASLTIERNPYVTGDRFTVTLATPDAAFDGERLVTDVDGDVVSFASVASDVPATDTVGTASSGPFVAVKPGKMTGFDKSTRIRTYEVKVNIWFAYADNSDYDYVSIENVIFDWISTLACIEAWADKAPFPEGIEMADIELIEQEWLVVGLYALTFRFIGA